MNHQLLTINSPSLNHPSPRIESHRRNNTVALLATVSVNTAAHCANVPRCKWQQGSRLPGTGGNEAVEHGYLGMES